MTAFSDGSSQTDESFNVETLDRLAAQISMADAERCWILDAGF